MKRSNRYETVFAAADFSRPAILLLLAAVGLLAGCTPRVEVALPDKPIEININAKIDHEVRVKVEREVEQLIEQQKGLY